MERLRRLTRHWLPAVVAVLATVAVVLTAPDESQAGSTAQDVLGDRQPRIMAPADPGGGWDQTAR
jgi:putative tricarboxylic transport membrane protein